MAINNVSPIRNFDADPAADAPATTETAHYSHLRATRPAYPAQRPAPRRTARPTELQPVTEAPQARGFALYVGLDELSAQADGISLTELVTELREVIAKRAPSAGQYASVAFAPANAGGADVDVVRLALQEPTAVNRQRAQQEEDAQAEAAKAAEGKVVIDTSRKRVLVNGENADFTYKEFELLQALVLREGRTVSREEVIEVLWHDADEAQPNERTIDVHVRRLRRRLGDYGDIVRTVRGKGYRFDRHADVRIVHALTPSPFRAS